MEYLPVEMVLNIASRLSVKDLGACCKVSVRWREIFGCDDVWKPRCNIGIAEYLQTSQCRVTPKFVPPGAEDSTLSPMEKWKLAFSRESHVCQNWANKNYTVVNTGADRISTKQILFVNNDFLLVIYDDLMDLRNTRGSRSISVAQIKMWSEHIEFKVYIVRQDLVVTVNVENYVQVIEVDTVKCTLEVKHAFFIDGIHVPKSNDRYLSCPQCAFVGNIFLGWSNLTPEKLNIWDLDNETMLKEEPHPIVSGRFNKMFSSKNCEDVVITSHLDWRLNMSLNEPTEPCHCFVYNVKTMKFLSFRLSSMSPFSNCAIIKDYVAVGFDTCVKVYNYKTSKYLFQISHKRQYEFAQPFKVVASHNDMLLFHHGNTLESFSPSVGRCFIRHDVAQFLCNDEDLVGVVTTRGVRQVFSMGSLKYTKTIETVWNIKKTKVNAALTKLLVPHEKEILIYVFW